MRSVSCGDRLRGLSESKQRWLRARPALGVEAKDACLCLLGCPMLSTQTLSTVVCMMTSQVKSLHKQKTTYMYRKPS